MNLSKKHYTILLVLNLLLCNCCGVLYAQDNGGETFFERSSWEETTEGISFDETYEEKKKEERKEEQTPVTPRNLKVPEYSGFSKLILIIIIAGAIGVLLFFILKNTAKFFDEKVPRKEFTAMVDNLEENIHKADFNSLLDEALAQKDYKRAVRIYFLNIIKLLSDKGLIAWKKNKTNGRYMLEMQKHKAGKDFSMVSLIYEQVWFGTIAINEEKYQKINTLYSKFITKVN